MARTRTDGKALRHQDDDAEWPASRRRVALFSKSRRTRLMDPVRRERVYCSVPTVPFLPGLCDDANRRYEPRSGAVATPSPRLFATPTVRADGPAFHLPLGRPRRLAPVHNRAPLTSRVVAMSSVHRGQGGRLGLQVFHPYLPRRQLLPLGVVLGAPVTSWLPSRHLFEWSGSRKARHVVAGRALLLRRPHVLLRIPFLGVLYLGQDLSLS